MGGFQQTPDNHLSSQGCPVCGYEKRAAATRIDAAEFLARATARHAGRYDYSLVEYAGRYVPVVIICPKAGHGEFIQQPNSHMRGGGCPECVNKLFYHSKDEITLAHELLYFLEFDPDEHKVRVGDRNVNVDIVMANLRLAVEFDSYIYHKDRHETDRQKTNRLVEAGWRVIRVREEPLGPLFADDVVVPQRNRKIVANRVLRQIELVSGTEIDGLGEYIESKYLANESVSKARIDTLLRDKNEAESSSSPKRHGKADRRRGSLKVRP